MNKRLVTALVIVTALAALIVGAAGGAALTYAALHMPRLAQAAAELTRAQADADADAGVLIAGVAPDSPAAEAGLRRGDIVLQVNGQAVNQPRELMEQLHALQAGSEVDLTVQRGDGQLTLTATLVERDGGAFLGIAPCGGPHDGEAGMVKLHGFGALIHEVVPDSPAAQAGLQTGDLITAVDGEEFGPDRDLAAAIRAHEPGESVTLTVRRPGEEEAREVSVTLGENPEHPEAAYLGVRFAPLPRFEGPGGRGLPFGGRGLDRPGFHFALPPDLGIDHGLFVGKVEADGPAAGAGLRHGDIITAIDGERADDPRDLIGAVAARQPGDTLTLTICRVEDQSEHTLEVTLGEKDGHAYLGVGGVGFFGIHGFGTGEEFPAPEQIGPFFFDQPPEVAPEPSQDV